MRAAGASVAKWYWTLKYKLAMPLPVHFHLSGGAVQPKRAHLDDGCYDIVANSDPVLTTLPNGSINIGYDTGVRIALPIGWHTLIYPRSSVTKYPLIMGNSVGYADNGYRGTYRVNFKYIGSSPLRMEDLPKKGDRIAQVTFVQSPKTRFFEAVNENDLPASHRGENGWGSTGTK